MNMMNSEFPIITSTLKTAAFKCLLQGPQSFTQFSSSSGVSAEDIKGWIDDALTNLELAEESVRAKRSSFRLILTHEERRTLLEGKLPHEDQA